MKILMDTDILVEFLLGNEITARKIENYAGKDALVISSLTLAEVVYAVNDPNLVVDLVETFPVLEFDDRAALKMVQILSSMEFQRKLPFRFVFNASVALANDAVLLTKKRELYSTIPGLKLV
jgi:predicted nucleic acid-binding protein